ncbi:MAG: tetratricopeptide repeat protein [Candidatus Obscuribacterales bacterium]|nr:tetratricopeptide repeat protein [Candidatus Obscuribacterales bacterium]
MNANYKSKCSFLLVILAFQLSVNGCFALDATVFPGKGRRDTWNKACHLVNEGNALAKAGNREASISRCKQAIELYPYADAFYLNLGIDYQERKDLPKAEAAFRKATQLDPKDWRNWKALAGALGLQEKYKECRDVALRALQCNPPADKAAEMQASIKSVEDYLKNHK